MFEFLEDDFMYSIIGTKFKGCQVVNLVLEYR